MPIDIIIVNWNSGFYLRKCLESIEAHGGESIGKVFVVDNCSSDKSETIVHNYPKIQLIKAPTNLGFAKACNIGAKLAKNEYFLFLNPDAALQSDSLIGLLQTAERPENSEAGIFGVQLKDATGYVSRSCAKFPSALDMILKATGLAKLIPTLDYHMVTWDHLKSRSVDHVIGACYLVRRALYEELDGFDERFFVYLEDLDFSYRARKRGWRTHYLADIQAVHAGGGSSNQVKAARLFYALRSRIQYSFKHHGLLPALCVLAATLLIEPIIRLGVAISQLSWESAREVLQAYAKLSAWLFWWSRRPKIERTLP